MAERKSVNKYYPPDWDPSKGSINEYVGQHPLRDRARKLGQGILIIRFEMPYNIWCGGCNNHIGMGVRYNAEKKKTGMYYTTPIYTFRMKCHLCDNHFEIQTDPKNHDYVIIEGARRKEQRWDPKENGQIVPDDKAVHKKMALDAMFNLEHGSDDVQKGHKAVAHLNSVESLREQWKDDYLLNKLAREKFRTEKKAINLEALKDSALLTKSSLDIPLMDETEEDLKLAGLMKYRALETYDEKQAQKRKDIDRQPMFEENKKAKTDSVNKKLNIIMKHLQTTKANTQNPFDTTKMNMYASPTALSKQALGIRKKNLPKYSVQHTTQKVATSCGRTNDLEPEQCHNNVDKVDHGFVNIDSPTLETTSNPDYIHTDSTSNLAIVNANFMDDDRKLDAVVDRNRKIKIPMDVEDIVQDQDDDVCPNKDSDIVQSCANSNIGLEKNSLTSDKTSHEHVTDVCKTALSLVCTYSDSDSDTLGGL